jgi:DNA-binding NtrC family response regulator
MRRLLIVEHSSSSSSIAHVLSSNASYSCERVHWETFEPSTLDAANVHLLVAVAVPALSPTLALLESLNSRRASVPTLVVFPSDSEPSLLHTASLVADDFMFWPIHHTELMNRVSRLLGMQEKSTASTAERLAAEMGMSQLVGIDETFTRIVTRIPLVARTEAPVLVTGETGTGKEMCARAIHYLSKRRGNPFIPVDCGALPDHLFENEVFGHVRGAYTDARGDQKGLVAMAEKGTLFLDEVDSLSLPAQAKLLRFLQERTYKPLGSASFARADVNVIAASNRDLESCVTAKQFRPDLFFRLNVVRLHLPPLRERLRDIALLAEHFLRTLSSTVGHKQLSPAGLRKLQAHNWPGNVRELSNALHRAALFSEGPLILPTHIGFGEDATSAQAEIADFRQARARAIEVFERSYVEDMLRKHSGNVTRAAIEAQQDRRAFGRLIKKYGIDRTSV